MDSMMKTTPSEAHPETMDFLSRTWCNFAMQTLQPDQLPTDKSIILLDNQLKPFDCEVKSPFPNMEKGVKMEDDFKSLPPWKSNDVKSWIWMQQAMHPELNYNSCFRKKWLPWNIAPIKTISIKKWLEERKQKRKEEERLERAKVHAAISVAGVAAALAAIAAENTKKDGSNNPTTTKDDAVASAAALVAEQCAQVAEAMGAKKEQLSSMIGSAMSGTSASDILTLTASAASSLRGAATLKARTGFKKKINGSTPVLPLEDNTDTDFDLEKCRSILANGIHLHVETPDGNFQVRSVSIFMNNQAKIILKLRKLNLLKTKKESIIQDMHAELYKDSEAEEDETENTCYMIVLTTNEGIIKLDMGDDYHRYKTWAATINHMLMVSSSFSHYQLQFYRN